MFARFTGLQWLLQSKNGRFEQRGGGGLVIHSRRRACVAGVEPRSTVRCNPQSKGESHIQFLGNWDIVIAKAEVRSDYTLNRISDLYRLRRGLGVHQHATATAD